MTTTTNNNDVAAFLRDHPDFFQQHTDLLESLRLPDPRGSAVSLLERQAQVLRDRNAELHKRLERLVDIARENDRLFEKTRKLVLQLLEAQHLDGLIGALFTGLQQQFNTDTISLLLYQDDANIMPRGDQVRCVRPADLPDALQVMLQRHRAVCGTLRDSELEALFSRHHKQVQSAAMVPLYHQQSLGLLAIGSFDANHFKSSLGTLFISHLGEVLSRSLIRFQPSDRSNQVKRA